MSEYKNVLTGDRLLICQEAYERYSGGDSLRKIADDFGVAASTILRRLRAYADYLAAGEAKRPERMPKKAQAVRERDFRGEFDVPKLPSGDVPVEELIDRLCRDYTKKAAAEAARSLIPIKIKIDGPIGITAFGDPHLDDGGTDWPKLRRDVAVVRETEGMFGLNIGDTHNNWIGRLVRKYADQHTTRDEAFRLCKWFFDEVPWLAILLGNHDSWQESGLLIGMAEGKVIEDWKARIGLRFPNGREVTINAAHDFPGNSQWNVVHGVAKAAQMGMQDDILVAGHKHTSGYYVHQQKDGRLSHAVRVAGYKRIDDYAVKGGFHVQDFGPSCTFIIDPDAASNVGLVTVLWDTEEAAEYLTFKRRQHAAGRRRA